MLSELTTSWAANHFFLCAHCEILPYLASLLYTNYVVYRVPATGSPIPKDRMPEGAMIGWHVARHWAAAMGAEQPVTHVIKMASTFKQLVFDRFSSFFGSKSIVKG